MQKQSKSHSLEAVAGRCVGGQQTEGSQQLSGELLGPPALLGQGDETVIAGFHVLHPQSFFHLKNACVSNSQY